MQTAASAAVCCVWVCMVRVSSCGGYGATTTPALRAVPPRVVCRDPQVGWVVWCSCSCGGGASGQGGGWCASVRLCISLAPCLVHAHHPRLVTTLSAGCADRPDTCARLRGWVVALPVLAGVAPLHPCAVPVHALLHRAPQADLQLHRPTQHACCQTVCLQLRAVTSAGLGVSARSAAPPGAVHLYAAQSSALCRPRHLATPVPAGWALVQVGWVVCSVVAQACL